ncbi:hypothetical protein QYE76_040952 [Lolium multiflorum]|uniref:Arabidopsis retrotransposon Orf1 C-terminal domain-containing protein n=1 Tax=Lolium multiflorum TaxID=4521 RepID=A0AAD8WTN7_LOLMU|nr:hypothetical protein QYE76_040952 [Lolium multiflorum]
MGKPRDTKIAILPSTTRKGTTLSTSAALDSPSVISKLVSPPQASNDGTSAESENSSYNCDDASAVLDNDGLLGSFLDATIARSRQIENTETPNENAATPVNSPESVEYSSDDLDEDYVELDDDFIEKCNATTDARKIKSCLQNMLKRTPDDAEELLAKIGRNHDDWSTPEPTPTPILKKRGMIKLNDEDMREAKKSLKEKVIKPEDVKNLPPIEDLCKITPPSSMIEWTRLHLSRSSWDPQLVHVSAPDPQLTQVTVAKWEPELAPRPCPCHCFPFLSPRPIVLLLRQRQPFSGTRVMSSFSSTSRSSWPQYGPVPLTRCPDCPRQEPLKRSICKTDENGNRGREFVACESLPYREGISRRIGRRPVQAPVAASNVAAGASAAAPVQSPVDWDPYEPVQYDAPENPYDTTIVDYEPEVESSDVDSDDESFHTKTRHVLRRLQSGQYGRPFAQGIYKCPFCNRRLFDTNFNTLLNHVESIGRYGARVGSTVNVHAYMAKHKALGIHLRNLQASHTRHLEALNVPTALSKRKMKKFNFGELFKRGTTSTGRPSRASTQIRRSYNEDIIAPSFAPEEDNGAPNASSFPCYDFLTNAGILDDFFTLVNRAGLATYVGDEREQYYMLTKIFVESFKFHNTQYEPTVAFKIYGNPVTMELEEFCRALDIAPVGTARRIDDNPRDLLELYRGITDDDCRTIQRGKIRNIQLPAIKYFAYYIATSILGRENTSNISSYHLAFLNAALTGQTPYHLGSLIARRLSSRGPIFGGTIALRILTHLRLPLDPNDVPLTPRRLDIAAMKSHHFVTTDSTVDNMVYRMLFADGDEKEIPLPQPGLFNIDRQSWSRTKEEVEEHMKIQDFHQQHDSEDAEPSYDYTVTYPDASSSTYLEPGRSSSYYGDTTSWGPWE